MKKIFFAFFVLFCVLQTACSLFSSGSYNEPRLFDIGIPEVFEDVAYEVDIQPFTSDGAGRFKMLYRIENNELDTDEYNRWTQPPGALLTKYLRMAFSSEKIHQVPLSFRVSGSVLTFEADYQTNVARLFVTYRVVYDNGNVNKLYVTSAMFTEKLQNKTPAAFASAMSATAAKFANHLREELDAIVAGKMKNDKADKE